MTPRQGFEKVSDVKTHQDSLASSFGYKTSKESFRASEVINQEIDRLKTLQGQLLTQEKQLFSAKSIESYENLRNKVQEWNSSGASSLLSNTNEIYSLIKEISKIISFNNFEKNFNNLLDQNIPEITNTFAIDIVEGDTVNSVMKEFLSRLSDLEKKMIGGKSKFLSFRYTVGGAAAAMGNTEKLGSRAGLLQYVKIKIENTTDGKQKANFSFSNNLSTAYQSRITKIFNEIIKQSNIQNVSMTLGEQEINSIINRILGNITGNARPYLELELRSRFFQYDINKSAGSIKGFLGEVYWNAFWRFISNGRLLSAPTGTVRATTGEEIPIDFILKGLGFQVKNYTLTENFEATFRKSMTLSGFLKERLQADVMEFDNFYISWGYNKINQNYADAEEQYGELFGRFERIMSDVEDKMQSLAESRMDRIIKLDSEFQSSIDSKLKLQGRLGVKSNVAFLIGSNIVFGSDIVKSIIQIFEAGEMDIYFRNFDFVYKEPYAEKVWPEPDKTPAKTLMSGSSVEYEIVMNVGNLVQRAIQRLG